MDIRCPPHTLQIFSKLFTKLFLTSPTHTTMQYILQGPIVHPSTKHLRTQLFMAWLKGLLIGLRV
jgi:hypothetical protein